MFFYNNSRLSIESTTNNKETPLHLAAAKGHHYIVEYLAKQGCNMNAKTSAQKNQFSFDQFTPLHLAITNNHLKTVDCLLKNGADLNTRDNDGDTPLLVAVSLGFVDIAKKLIENRANINEKNPKGEYFQ